MNLNEFLCLYPEDVQRLFHRLKVLMEITLPDSEQIFFEGWKNLSFGTGKGRSAPSLAVYLAPLKDSVNLGFYAGTDLTDPSGLLKGSGKKMRHIKMRPDTGIPEEEIIFLVLQAYNNAATM